MPLTEFSTRVRDALLKRFPEFAPYTRTAADQSHIEIRFSNPRAPLDLFVTTDRDEVSIFFDKDHRHIGMCRDLSVDQQISEAKQFIAGVLSGSIPLVKDTRSPDLRFYDDPNVWGHDPDEKLTFTTWQNLMI